MLTTRRLRQPGNITKANTFQQTVSNVILGPTKAPAAARKASPKLIHVKRLITQFSLRNACGNGEDLIRVSKLLSSCYSTVAITEAVAVTISTMVSASEGWK